jgi:hypothetical protein
VILRSRGTLRRPTTGHLVDASTSSTTCTSSAAFLPGPSLVKKRLLHCILPLSCEAYKSENAPPGTRRRWGNHIAPGSGTARRTLMEYASPHPVLHRSFLTRVDRRAWFRSQRRLPSRTLVCRYTLARPDHCPSHPDPIRV